MKTVDELIDSLIDLAFAEDIGEESTDYNYESVDNLTEEIEDSVDDEDKVIEFLDLMKDKSISTTSEKNSALNNFELEEPKPENENIIDVIDFFDDEKDNIEEELPSDFFEEELFFLVPFFFFFFFAFSSSSSS